MVSSLFEIEPVVIPANFALSASAASRAAVDGELFSWTASVYFVCPVDGTNSGNAVALDVCS